MSWGDDTAKSVRSGRGDVGDLDRLRRERPDELNRRLLAENADLRRAVPFVDEKGQTVWPSIHDNPTVLREHLFERDGQLDAAEAEGARLRTDVAEAARLLRFGAPYVFGWQHEPGYFNRSDQKQWRIETDAWLAAHPVAEPPE